MRHSIYACFVQKNSTITGVQNEQNKVFFTSMEHNKLYGIALIRHCRVQLTSLCHHISIISHVISYNMAKILDLIATSPITLIFSADDHQAQAENKHKYKNIRIQFDLDKLQDPTHSSGRSSISNHLVYIIVAISCTIVSFPALTQCVNVNLIFSRFFPIFIFLGVASTFHHYCMAVICIVMACSLS